MVGPLTREPFRPGRSSSSSGICTKQVPGRTTPWRTVGPHPHRPAVSSTTCPRSASAAALRSASRGSVTPRSARRTSLSPSAPGRAAQREGEALKAQIARLRQALEERRRKLRNAVEETEQLHQVRADLEVQHAAEQPHYEHLVEELRASTRRLQARACARWDAARTLQASLRVSEQQAEVKVEDLMERQRKLELERARLRKATAALKSRIFGWKQSQRRLRGQQPAERRRPSVQEILASLSLSRDPERSLESVHLDSSREVPKSFSARSSRRSSGSSVGVLAPVEDSEDSFPGSGQAPPAEESVAPDELDQMREELRAAEERAAKASAELSAAQAELEELSSAIAEKRPPLRRSSSYVEQEPNDHREVHGRDPRIEEACSTSAASAEKDVSSTGSKSQETSP